MNNTLFILRFSNSMKYFLTLGTTLLFFLILHYDINNLMSLSKISMILWLFLFFSWIFIEKEIINFYSIFLVFIFMFYFGDFFLYIIDYDFTSNRNITSGLVAESIIKISVLFLMKFLLIMHFFVIVTSYFLSKNKSIKSDNKHQISTNMLNSLKISSVVIFMITCIPSFSILFSNIYTTFTQGYGQIFLAEEYSLGGFSNIKRFISSFFIPNLFLMLILFKDTKYIKLIISIIIFYLGLYFLSGSRINAILIIAAFVMIKNYWYKKVEKKEYIYLMVLLITMSILLPLISELRNDLFKSSIDTDLFINMMNNLVNKNPILTNLEESGYTFLVIATVINNVGINVEYIYGLSYVNNLFMILPNVFWDVHPATSSNTDLAFQDFLTIYGGIGSSFIAEAYYNFGKYSISTAAIFGCIVAFVTYKIKVSAKNKNLIQFYIYIYASSLILIYVRSDTVSFLRNITLYAVAPLLLGWLISKISKNKRKS
ncbi:O-antigen polysaccharide polymerase Wzy [Exiguobacterium undae]|uniref:O-antigen polysaccharide polymerase Wzy n=1 Tax=Exiguobacterium undae TaxID=169177 RepID=UPI00047954FA|nr:O-antigen polysaccharide polymerase Wzy [Exiguobacterium undae]